MSHAITAPRSVFAGATVALAVLLGACGSSSSGKKSSNTTASSETTTTTAASTATTANAANALANAPAPGSHFDTTISFVKLPNAGGLILVGIGIRIVFTHLVV